MLEGSQRPLLVTSGVALLAQGRVATEDDGPVPVSDAYPRSSEATAMALAARGVLASVVRLAPSVHGRGDRGFVAHLIRVAREKGVSAYIGDGLNRWPAVHRRDAARAFRLALERRAAAAKYHAIDEPGIAFREIAQAIGRGVGVPVVALAPEAAAAHFGWFACFAMIDAAASSQRTREVLGWQPTQPGLLDDIDAAGYFESAA
ncbi:hypothetical protein BTO02_06345 [Paraburkholderia sp. SOS3]|nr:hypothetical protein BTO02_06345 [Paraburkholderia sp. SOS3]